MNGVIDGKAPARGGVPAAICPHCGADMPGGTSVCPGCGYHLAQPARASVQRANKRRTGMGARVAVNVLTRLLIICFSVAFFGYLFYTAYFWFDNWRTDRIYEDGTLTPPVVEQIEMPNGELGHSLTFFGADGDQLFIPELNRSYPFVGGMTQIDIADSSWFDISPENDKAAIVTMTPVISTSKNGRINLPEMQLTIETPKSPLDLLDPKSDRIEVDTSHYTMKLQVVPGSKVLINGEDQTDMVSHEGLLTPIVNVYPRGENPVSISVTTPHHQQTRRDIVLYRAPQTIEMERSMNLDKTTNKTTITISGTVEPGANILVDSSYVEGSLKVDPDGKFSFKAKLSIVGDNVITWHATMEGRQDQMGKYTVYYVPTLNEYSRKAWKMDYPGLLTTNEKWAEAHRVFKVTGPVVSVYEEDGVQKFAIDVAPAGAEAPQYCVLENKSTVTAPEVGMTYDAYADVVGGFAFYDDTNCPQLICRYLINPR